MASKLALFNFSRLAVYRLPPQFTRCLSCSAVRWDNDETKAPGQTIIEAKAKRSFSAFMKEKTGTTGAGMLIFGVSAFLLSKEYYVMNGETLLAMVLGGLSYYGVKKLSKPVTNYLDSMSQEHLDFYTDKKNEEIKVLNVAIENEKSIEHQAAQLKDIFEIMRDVNSMKLETEYRRRQDEVRQAVVKRLNYRMDVEATQRKHEHQHLLQWIEASVKEAVKGKQDESFNQCMDTLKKMSVA